jgi:hypothetical protein
MMSDLNSDPVHNVIYNQIKRSIGVLIENKCWGAAVILVYSGIDTMAYLSLPENQEEVKQKDFIAWAERYIHFPCKEQLTGADLYGARCGLLHTYSPYSAKSRKGECRLIGYGDNMVPEVRYDPKIKEDFVLVSIKGLVEAFFRGVDQYLIDLFSDSTKIKVVEERLLTLSHSYPVNKD